MLLGIVFGIGSVVMNGSSSISSKSLAIKLAADSSISAFFENLSGSSFICGICFIFDNNNI